MNKGACTVSNRIHHRRGMSVLECVFALGILGMLTAMGTYAFGEAGEANRRHVAHRQCVAAAEAQLESIAQTGEPLPADEVGRLWPGVDVTVERRAGKGDWKGSVQYTVTARSIRQSGVTVTLQRYVAAEGGGTP